VSHHYGGDDVARMRCVLWQGPVWWPWRGRLARLPARQERVDCASGYPPRSRRT